MPLNVAVLLTGTGALRTTLRLGTISVGDRVGSGEAWVVEEVEGGDAVVEPVPLAVPSAPPADVDVDVVAGVVPAPLCALVPDEPVHAASSATSPTPMTAVPSAAARACMTHPTLSAVRPTRRPCYVMTACVIARRCRPYYDARPPAPPEVTAGRADGGVPVPSDVPQPSPAGRRPRVLIGAYACGPGGESEANAGWEFAVAATHSHDVWLVTRQRFRPWIEAAFAADPALAERLSVRYLELGERALAVKRNARDVYWYYALWQRELGRLGNSLHAQLRFDVAHHLTFAADWLPCGLTRLPAEVPLVWGPVGGATYPPLSMLRWYPPRAVVGELGRSAFTRLARRAFGDPAARRATLVLAQNEDVARRFRKTDRVALEANSAIDDVVEDVVPRMDGGARRAVFVGRLVAWKGPLLAVHALAEPGASEWTLDVYGSGPETPRLRKAIATLGLAERVTLHGQRPRAEVLAAYRDADALLFPSMHDSAPWAVSEASAAGCAVVCLDLGGPPLLAGPNAIAVAPGPAAVAGLADGLRRAAAHERTPWNRWGRGRLPALVADWYATAAQRGERARRAP